MLISYNWLKQFVKLPDSVTPEDVALNLKNSTVEVEGIKRFGENLENIVVGRVETVQNHPNADKLKVCTVAYGEKFPVQIVCGGSNVEVGMLVALAGLGAKVRWHGEGELVELKKVQIRGIDSYGMICASTEIGLGTMFPLKSEKEILDLSFTKAKVGTLVSVALGLNDTVLEIDNKSLSNRPDLWGHYGIAREVAVLFNKKLAEYKVSALSRKDSRMIELKVKVEDTKLCPRYMAVAIDGVEVKESPAWLKEKLQAVGLRSINNIVDITNYVMYELGQPMHAFDSSKLKNEGSKVEIMVRRAKDGEEFVTLDEQKHKLTSEMLVIADSEKAVALAGVMGGLYSGISNDTKTIIFESANFDGSNIRKTSTTLGLRSDSSARFEKSLDPNLCEVALKKAVELTLELNHKAKVVSKVIDIKNYHLNLGPLELTYEFIQKKIGVEIDKKEIIRILENLGFGLKENKKKNGWLVTVPTWRATKDITILEDLVEEVLRIYGYAKVSATLPVFFITPPVKNELRQLERKIKEILTLESGFTEVYNYSFLSPELMKKIGLPMDDHIELANPIAKDRPYLRHNLWPSLLENVENNLHRFDKLKLFEIGKVFTAEKPGLRVSEKSDELLPRQDLMLGAVYAEKGVAVPFYELSSALAGLMNRLGYVYKLVSPKKDNQEDLIAHQGRGATIQVSGEIIGAIAELHPVAQKNLGIESRVVSLEINLDKLLECKKESLIYKHLSEFPSVVRDIAFVVNKKVEYRIVVEALKEIDPLIVEVELFDVYDPSTATQGKGKNLPENKKSVAYHIIYQSKERTLITEEVEKIQEKVVKIIEKKFEGEVRK